MRARVLFAGLMLVAVSSAWAKLPPPSEEQKAAAAAAKAKADDAAKRDGVAMGKAQDRTVANYRKNKGSKAPMATGGKKK